MNNLTGTVEIHEKAPNFMLAVINLGGAAFEQGFDGNIGWSDNPQNGLRELSGGELDDARREANFYHALELRKNYTKMTVTGIERVERARHLRAGGQACSKARRTKCTSTCRPG